MQGGGVKSSRKADFETITRGESLSDRALIISGFTNNDERSIARSGLVRRSIPKSGLVRHAFTLAEVLITLGIIGIVAAMTIPGLIQNYQKKTTVERLKQTYSILQQAVKQSEIDNGELQYWDLGGNTFSYGLTDETYELSKAFAEKYMVPYLKIEKICQPNTTECWTATYKNMTNSNIGGQTVRLFGYSVILSNGAVLGFWARGRLVEINVDINGKTNPNATGKDRFNLIITNQNQLSLFGKINKPGVYFYGSGYNRNYLKTNGYACAFGFPTSTYCGALIQIDGWEIKDDYPW